MEEGVAVGLSVVVVARQSSDCVIDNATKYGYTFDHVDDAVS